MRAGRQIHGPTDFFPGEKISRYSFNMRIDGPHSSYGHFGQDKYLPIQRIEPWFLGSPVCSLVTKPINHYVLHLHRLLQSFLRGLVSDPSTTFSCRIWFKSHRPLLTIHFVLPATIKLQFPSPDLCYSLLKTNLHRELLEQFIARFFQISAWPQ